MTQVKLWQIVSQTSNAIIFSDADGNLTSLPAGRAGQVLVAGPDGAPMWTDDTALATALQAKTDAASAIATAKAYTEAQIAALVDNAPVALNTLNELAQKLNGEDSAINALLLQVDGKAEKTEVATQVAQAKQSLRRGEKARGRKQEEATGEGLLVTDQFTEVTGAAVVANDSSLNAKLLFINGVAVSDEWAAKKVGNGQLMITMSERLARHVFDGTENAVMLLAEYKSYNTISVKS